MPASTSTPIGVCLELTRAIGSSQTVEQIYTAALDALERGLGVTRSSILLFDDDGVMRFKAYRRLSAEYRAAVEGHTPWTPDSPDPQPIVVDDVTRDASLAPYCDTILGEGIAAMAFIPLVSQGRVIGKFMLYDSAPRALTSEELQLAGLIASQVAFAVARTRAEEQARRSEERLRFALDAASMGTWDWDITANRVVWSENLERVHGLPAGTFDGTFQSYEREIHAEDRERVLASAHRAIAEGVPHDVEYRIVSPDGTVRWVEGKGRVEYQDGVAVRMSGVCMNVTRRKEAELARLAAAEEASRSKDEFLATLSHELRTPLNAILGWVQMVQAGDLSPERTRQAMDVIGRNARLQGQLIEDILDVSRIITGKLDVERHPVFVPQLIETVVAGITPEAQSKQITIERDVPAALPPIEGDPKRLHQVLANVVANAVKFTPTGGRIAVRARARDEAVVIETRDSGVGIAPDFLPYIFDRFRQADGRSTRRHGGLGLGLAIARHLLEQHGGAIAAHSDGPGQGTTMVISLPAGSHLTAQPDAQGHGAAARGGDVRMDGITVVVVDDEQDSRELLAAVLERAGARVVRCESAKAAASAVLAGGVHLLVADIAMPDVDGHELLRQLRKLGIEVPAIAVSAYARHEDRSRAKDAGYVAYCSKPLDTEQFLQFVRASIGPPAAT